MVIVINYSIHVINPLMVTRALTVDTVKYGGQTVRREVGQFPPPDPSRGRIRAHRDLRTLRGRVSGGKARPQACNRGTPAPVFDAVPAKESQDSTPFARRYVCTDGRCTLPTRHHHPLQLALQGARKLGNRSRGGGGAYKL